MKLLDALITLRFAGFTSLVPDSICIQGFEPTLGIIAPINPMMAGISLVPPPPVQPELPVIKEIIHCKSCTLFPQNPSKCLMCILQISALAYLIFPSKKMGW